MHLVYHRVSRVAFSPATFPSRALAAFACAAALILPAAASAQTGQIGRHGIGVTYGAWSEGSGRDYAEELTVHYNHPLTAGFDLLVDAVAWGEFNLEALEIPGVPPEPTDPNEPPDQTSEIRVGGLFHRDSAAGKVYAAVGAGLLRTEFPKREEESGGVYWVECGMEMPASESVAVCPYVSWKDDIGIDNVDFGRVEIGMRLTVNLGPTWRLLASAAYQDNERWGGAAGVGWQW